MSKQQSNRSRSKIGRVSVWRNLLSIATKNQREAAPVGSSNRTDAVADFGRSSLPRRNFQIAVRRTKVGPACRAGFFVTAARRSVCGLQHRASKNHHRYLRPPDCEMAPCKVAGRGEAAKSFPAERTYDYFRRRRTKVGPACRAGFSPQGEPSAGNSIAHPKTVTVISGRLILTWHLARSQVAASREVLSGRKDLLCKRLRVSPAGRLEQAC